MGLYAKLDQTIEQPAKSVSCHLGGLWKKAGGGHTRDRVGFQHIKSSPRTIMSVRLYPMQKSARCALRA
jgi:hypothetical protein